MRVEPPFLVKSASKDVTLVMWPVWWEHFEQMLPHFSHQTSSYLLSDIYPFLKSLSHSCFGLLVTFPLSFRARVAVSWFTHCWRCTCFTFLDILLWWSTCQPLDSPHGGRLLFFLRANVSGDRKLGLNNHLLHISQILCHWTT